MSVEDVREMIKQAAKNIGLQFQAHQADTKQQLSALDRLNHYPSHLMLIGYMVTTIVGLIVFVIAMMQLVRDRWENGLGSGSTFGKQVEQTNRAIEDINKKMDRLIEEDSRKK